ncbi:MAG: Fic family protein, partial [Fibrobacteres bacterium]|nr:Fic family protein [Fibrobacterota bacterium]
MPMQSAVILRIPKLRERFYTVASGKDALLSLISESEVAEQVYNSNAIENSTLTLEETEKVLLKIDLDRYITERELFEAKNLSRVVSYIGAKAKEKELNSELILLLHKMLLSNIRDDVAGRYRIKGEWVRVGSHIAVNPEEINTQIEKMFIEYNSKADNNVVKRIAKFHLTFENIHPFVDGNGRIGRVLNNYLLIREGYVPINIKFTDRQLYYNAFREYDTVGSTKLMESIITKA